MISSTSSLIIFCFDILTGMTASRSPQSTRSGYEASNVEYGFGSRRQDSKPEHCRRINRQIRNTLRYKQYTLCNVDSDLRFIIPREVCLRAWLRVHFHLNGCITLFCLQSVKVEVLSTSLSFMGVIPAFREDRGLACLKFED